MARRQPRGRDDARPAGLPPGALAWPNRAWLDLLDHRVTDRGAGLFDARARASLLRTTRDPVLRQAADAALAASGASGRSPSAAAYVERIPRFYRDRDAWREASRDLHAIEETVARLAAAFIASGERTHADRLVDLLAAWAGREALTRFHYAPAEPQTWYALEGTLFALGLSYAVVRPFVGDRAAETAGIDAWLARASRLHLAVDRNAWNNHYYRRALHAAAAGIVAGDDELFRFGVSAVHNALAELTPGGMFPREVARGARALHYQNYALLYLVPVMQLAARQGYPLWDLAPAGRTIHDAVETTLDLLAEPARAHRLTRREQDLRFTAQAQYFAWMEIVQARFPNARIEAFVRPYRPVFSRVGVGAATLYFYEPPAAADGTHGRAAAAG